MLTADTTTGDPAAWWGEGDYEPRERAYAPIHQRLIERLYPQPGERVLDVACGLGAVAARAARAGADVTAIDLAPSMIERASHRPEPVDWRIGDCQPLPFDDDSFDVVVSSFGVIFAPDPHRAAAELSRVCRTRLAVTAWIADPGRDLWRGCARPARHRGYGHPKPAQPACCPASTSSPRRASGGYKGKAAKRSGPGSSVPRRPSVHA